MSNLFINTDGGARGNPGPAAIGVVIKNDRGEIIGKISKTIGSNTNNYAEYTAVIAALDWVKEKNIRKDKGRISFFLDSTLVVNQLNGLFKVKENSLRVLIYKVRELENAVGGNVSYSYIPRGKNHEADLLVNEAFDKSR